MRFNSIQTIIGCSLISILSSCNSIVSNSSTINEQTALLKEFGASLEKTVSINNGERETLLMSSDSIDWSKELYFLSYLDQLSPTKFDIINTYKADSSISKSIYTPFDDKPEIKKLEVSFNNSTTTYQLETSKKTYLLSTKKSILLTFKNYKEQKIFQSYLINGSQKSRSNDSTSYQITGQAVYQ